MTPQRIDLTPFSKLDVTSTNNCCLSGSLPYGWTRHYSYFRCLPSSLDGSSPPGAPRLDEALQYYYSYFHCLPSSLPSSSRGRLRRGWSVRCLTSPPRGRRNPTAMLVLDWISFESQLEIQRRSGLERALPSAARTSAREAGHLYRPFVDGCS